MSPETESAKTIGYDAQSARASRAEILRGLRKPNKRFGLPLAA
jgi:hypothetical protein